jgi:uncharacterized phage-like protein YoqJ
MEQWQIDIAKEAIRTEILHLITEQKRALIKAGPGKDKQVTEIIDELHNQIGLRMDVIRALESL